MNSNKIYSLLAVPLLMLALGIALEMLFAFHPLILTGFVVMTLVYGWFAYSYEPAWLSISLYMVCMVGGMVIMYEQKARRQLLQDCYFDKSLSYLGTVLDVHTAHGALFQGFVRIRVQACAPYGLDLKTVSPFEIMSYQRYPAACHVGDVVYLDNIVLQKSSSSGLDNKMTFDDYLMREGALAAVFLQQDQEPVIVHRPSWCITRWIWQRKMHILDTIYQRCSERVYAYFALIFLGYKHIEQNQALHHVFNQWGLAHFLARAGLHIMLFIWMWQWLFAYIPLPGTCKRLLMFIVCGMYALFSWMSIPFFRSYVVFVGAHLAALSGRPYNFLYVLTGSCFIVLLFNPVYLFFLDFQLTYALTLILGWFGMISFDRVKT